MALSPEIEAILAQAAPPPSGGFADRYASQATSAAPEEPGLVEAGLRGLKQGATLGWGDELEAGLRSAFSDRKYTELRDEIRAKDKAAQEAHPWGYGLANVLGGIGTGLATGGVAGAAAKLGTKGVAALAGAEGALGAAGDSEADLTKGEVGKLAKDSAIGGAVGGVLGAGLHKVLGHYVDTSIERRARHLTEEIGEGAIPTVKRRLGKVTQADPTGQESLAVEVLDQDPEFLKALKAGKQEALDVTKERLDAHTKLVTPLYADIDRATGGVPLKSAVRSLDDAIRDADVPGNSNIRDALIGTRDDLVETAERLARRKFGISAGKPVYNVSLDSQEARAWVSRLLKRADTSMGSLSETERKVVKDEIHQTAHTFLKNWLESTATKDPALKPAVDAILESNRRTRLYASVKEALEKAQERKNWGAQNLRDVLSGASLPGVAALIGGGADVAGGGAAFAATKAAQAAGKALNRKATFELARLVRAAKAGQATKAMALDAVRAGVPVATTMGVLGAAGAAPDWAREIPGDLGATLADAAN